MLDRSLPVVLALVAAAPATAQLRWDIERDATLIWTRELRMRAEATEPAAKAGARPRLAEQLFAGSQRAATLALGDLDSRRQRLATPVEDVRDLAALLALDLRYASRAGKTRVELTRAGPLLGVLARVSWGKVTDGKQVIECSFEPGKRALREHAQRRVAERGRPRRKAARRAPLSRLKGVLPASGTLRIERGIDAANARISGFDSALSVDVDTTDVAGQVGGATRLRIDVAETWTWSRVTAPDDSGFQSRVDAAILSGRKYLHDLLGGKSPGAAPRGKKGKNRRANNRPQLRRLGAGHLALVILTMLKAGADPRDALMQKALADLRRRDVTDTYGLSVAIMAIEAVYTPPDERESLLSGRITAPVRREVSEADRAVLEEWTARLLRNVDSRVDPAYVRRWNYKPAARYDNSNSQYALLGLYAATLCGVEVSDQVWFASAKHWLDTQAPPDGKSVRLGFVSHRDLEAGKKRGRRTASSVTARPRGWTYNGPNARATTGSMTTAGITALVICRAALHGKKRGTRVLFQRIDDAIEGGFAWLAANFAIDRNPGKAAHHYYYLYGLERACELSQVALFGGHRWYFEGANYLIEEQSGKGSWNRNNLVDTCFAVLFLKKAALPVFTPGR